MKIKVFKDPVYGYINLREELITNIIDTPYFQRLRCIQQTSYVPLYSAALHNRFIHSIGVFHLGEIVANSIKQSLVEDNELKQFYDQTLEADFLLACLLHDVGHSPFSHSGEAFYLTKDVSDTEIPLYNKLLQIISDASFKKDFNETVNAKTNAAPHEIMSVCVGIKVFGKYIADKVFFARCILGLKYKAKTNNRDQLKNAYIQFLNSSHIDVDKIDYLLRDSYVIGFDTVVIDYQRLLSNVGIKKINENDENGNPYSQLIPVYKKNAISVIENVIYAHDSEKKWIQTHPVVLYESFLIKYSIERVRKYFLDKYKYNIFSFDSLINDDVNNPISYMADDDLIYLMKNTKEIRDNLVDEYMNRNNRRHPVWKSEADFKILFEKTKGKEWTDKFSQTLKKVKKFLEEECTVPIIDLNSLKELKDIKRRVSEKTNEIAMISRYDEILDFFNDLEKISKKLKIDFNYVVLDAYSFKSSFNKEAIKQLKITFPSLSSVHDLKDATNLLDSDNPTRKEFYYLYYKRNSKKDAENPSLQDFAIAFSENLNVKVIY